MGYLGCLAIAAAWVLAVLMLMFALALFFASVHDQSLTGFLVSIVLLTFWVGTFMYIFRV